MRKLLQQRKLLIATVTSGVLGAVLLAIPSIGSADPKPPVGAHRHFIVNANGTLVPVGPDLCDNPTDPATQQAFYNFHWNVHKGADGLADGDGAEITARGCDFVLPT
jgi:hypothetical protein